MIYALNYKTVYCLMLGGIGLWSFLWRQMKWWERLWKILNAVMCLIVLYLVLKYTVLYRVPSNNRQFMIFAPYSSEFYREMLMNVVLFLPLGLALSQVLPQKWPCWERVLLTIFVGGALSAAVEYTQYRFALGMAETDDVFCNALGALDGALSLSIGQWMKRCGRSRQSVPNTENQ